MRRGFSVRRSLFVFSEMDLAFVCHLSYLQTGSEKFLLFSKDSEKVWDLQVGCFCVLHNEDADR